MSLTKSISKCVRHSWIVISLFIGLCISIALTILVNDERNFLSFLFDQNQDEQQFAQDLLSTNHSATSAVVDSEKPLESGQLNLETKAQTISDKEESSSLSSFKMSQKERDFREKLQGILKDKTKGSSFLPSLTQFSYEEEEKRFLNASTKNEMQFLLRENNPKGFVGVNYTLSPGVRDYELFENDNIQRISFMILRVVVTIGATSMIDAPCRYTYPWMGLLLPYLEMEMPAFEYYCIDTDEVIMRQIQEHYKNISTSAHFQTINYRTENLPKADLAFSWNGLQTMTTVQMLEFLRNLKANKISYVLLENNQGHQNSPIQNLKSRPVNIRKAPYFFQEPIKIYGDISSNKLRKKQLLLYNVNKIHSRL